MTKRCVVDGCKSGCTAQRKQMKLLNLKQVSFFSAPNSPSQLEKWNNALAGNRKKISSKDVVCQLHFRDEDVETHFVVILADGTKHTLEREKYRLKKNAIPFLLPNKTEPEETTPDSNATTTDAFPSVLRPVEMIDRATSDSNATIETAFPSIFRRIDAIEDATTDSDAPNQDANPSTFRVSTRRFDHSGFESVSSTDELTNEDGDPLRADDDIEMYDGYDETVYSIEHLARDLRRTEWREEWVWSCRVNPSSIKFVQFDTSKLKPKICCSIDENMEITISVADESADHGMNGGTLQSFAEMMALLDEMKRLKVCEGTGYKTEMRAENCPIFLNTDNTYRKSCTSTRCVPCRALRHKLQRRKPCDLDFEKFLVVKKLRLLTRRHKTLQKTAKKLKAQIGRARKGCVTPEEEVTDELTLGQQVIT